MFPAASRRHLRVPSVSVFSSFLPTAVFPMSSNFVIRDYVVLKEGWSNKQNLKWNLINGKWHFTFYDMNSDTYLRVICGNMKVTHTDYDVERKNLKLVKQNFRHKFMRRR